MQRLMASIADGSVFSHAVAADVDNLHCQVSFCLSVIPRQLRGHDYVLYDIAETPWEAIMRGGQSQRFNGRDFRQNHSNSDEESVAETCTLSARNLKKSLLQDRWVLAGQKDVMELGRRVEAPNLHHQPSARSCLLPNSITYDHLPVHSVQFVLLVFSRGLQERVTTNNRYSL